MNTAPIIFKVLSLGTTLRDDGVAMAIIRSSSPT